MDALKGYWVMDALKGYWVMDAALLDALVGLLDIGRCAIGRRYAAIGVLCVGFAEVVCLRQVVSLREVMCAKRRCMV